MVNVMQDIKVITNFHRRPIEYDEVGEPYVKYKGERYMLEEFIRLDSNSPFPSFWHGACADSFFSGTLIHICDDEENNYNMDDSVILAHYY